MKVESEFEINQFIKYVNKSPNLFVVNKTYSKNNWKINLNDNMMYEMHMFVWERIQIEVPRFGTTREITQ